MNIFEQASKKKLRFPSAKGALTTEQLWDLPLQARSQFDLDNVAKSVNQLLKQETEESFVSVRENATKKELELQLEIIKHIISVKMADAETARNATARKAERETLLAILADKQTDALKELSVEDINKRLQDLS